MPAPSKLRSSYQETTCQVGALLGAILCFIYAQIPGRRWTIVYGCIVTMTGAALQTAAFSVAQMIGETLQSITIVVALSFWVSLDLVRLSEEAVMLDGEIPDSEAAATLAVYR
jgi:hypothetical protein